MSSRDPKDYYYFVKSSEEIYVYPIQDYHSNSGYDGCLVKINPILSRHNIHEESEQLYYTDMTVADTIATLERLGFVQNDEFDKDMDY